MGIVNGNDIEFNKLEKFDELVELIKAMKNNIKDELLDADTFIKKHHHINYCEVIINREGLICYVRPSHTETMIRLMGKTQEEIDKEMPIYETPINWLVDKSGFIAVWYEGYVTPKHVNIKQRIALNKLINAKVIKNNLF